MKPIDFLNQLLPAARQAQQVTGINYLVTLAQAALESAWGEDAPNFNYFGIKDTDRKNCQLLPTAEVSSRSDRTAKQVGLDSIDRIEPHPDHVHFIYHGKAWFETYGSVEEAFIEHGKIFFNKWPSGQLIYKGALGVINDPYKFADAISPIYASGLQYATLLKSIMKSLNQIILTYKL